MAKIQNRAKRVLAIAIALMMVFGACFTGMVTASAESLAAGLTAVATTSTSGYSETTSIADIEGGGITYTTAGMGAYKPYLHNVGTAAFPGGGVTLQFDGFVCTSAESLAGTRGYQAILIVLSSSPSDGEKCRLRSPNVSGFIIDAYNGNVDYVAGVNGAQSSHTVIQTVIENSNIIKYANITNVPFSINFAYDANGDITVSVAVTGNIETGVATGTLDAEKFASVVNAGSRKTYFSVSSVDCNKPDAKHPMSFNYYGFAESAALPAFAAGLTDVADTASDVKSGDMGGYAIDNSHWGTVDYIAGGGFRYAMFQHAGLGPAGYKINLGGYDGNWELLFSNYFASGATTDAGYGKFALNLSQTINEFRIVPKSVFIAFDTIEGKVYLAKANDDVATNGDNRADASKVTKLADIASGDAFKLENFRGKPFAVKWMQTGTSDSVEIAIVIDGQKYSSIVDKSLVKTGGTYTMSPSYAYVSMNNLYSSTAAPLQYKCFLNFYGYKAITPDYVEEARAEARQGIKVLASTTNNVYDGTDAFISNIEGGGIHYEAIGHYPFQLDKGMDCWPGKGFKLQFANYAETSTATTAVGYRQFVVFFNWGLANNSTYGPYWKGGNIGINIDAVEGQVELVKSDLATLANTQKYVQKVLIEDEMFLYDNFTGKVFSYEITPAAYGENDAMLTITVGDKSASCIIDWNEFIAVPEGFGTQTTFYPTAAFDERASKCNVSFSALLHDGTKAAVDFFGYTKYEGSVNVGSDNTAANAEASVPVSVTTDGVASMTVEVTADAAITAINAADGVSVTPVIDGNKAIVNITADAVIAGADVKLFDVVFTTGEGTIYTVDADVKDAANAAGDSVYLFGTKGAAAVTAVVPNASEIKYQATEGSYKLGTLGFGTSTTNMAALATDDFVAVEFGTVFFTAKMLGDQELKIGTTKVGGTATALTVSKALGNGETLPEQFIAILKDKASNESNTVSNGYRNTTYVARSFVRYYDKVNSVFVIIYGDTFSAKLADIAQ